MRRRHPIPRVWLMTDERLGAGLWDAMERLPRGAGVVFRHYATPAGERRRMFANLHRIAVRRGLVLVRAGAEPLPGEMGVHGRKGRGLRSFAVHSAAEARRARRSGAEVVFVSPMFATVSHAGAQLLSPARAMLLVRISGAKGIALGGMTAERFRRLRRFGFYGWAAIDAWRTEAGRSACGTVDPGTSRG